MGGELYRHLRIASKPYRKRYGHYDRRGKLVSRRDIDERPNNIVDRRSRIGDWDGDTIMGKEGCTTDNGGAQYTLHGYCAAYR